MQYRICKTKYYSGKRKMKTVIKKYNNNPKNHYQNIENELTILRKK